MKDFNADRCNFDYVFCIDKTARGCFYAINEELAEQILTLRDRLRECYPEFEIGRIRVRFVLFGDALADEEPFIQTPFYSLDTDGEEIIRQLDYRAGGGGDLPENGLEALALAIRSDFELVPNELNRHIICLYTDAPAHPLGRYPELARVPENMPKDLDELAELWETRMDKHAKRLYILAPDVEPWKTVSLSFTKSLCCHYKSGPGEMDARTLVEIVTSPKWNSLLKI